MPDGRGGVLVASLGGSGFDAGGGFGVLPGFSSAIGASPEGNPATLVGGPAGALTVAPVAGGMTIAAAVPAASKVQTSSWLPMETLAGSAESGAAARGAAGPVSGSCARSHSTKGG